jgi:hypothetical protein
MARYQGKVRGNRGEGSRLGSASSGIHAIARGWDVGVEVYGGKSEESPERDSFTVYATGGSNARVRSRPIARLIQLENGGVSVELVSPDTGNPLGRYIIPE